MSKAVLAMPKVLILGHSFMKHLNANLKDTFDKHADSNFHLEGTVMVHLLGVGGRTVEKLRHCDLHVVRRLALDVVILEVGTNGLSDVKPEVGRKVKVGKTLFRQGGPFSTVAGIQRGPAKYNF